MATPTLWAVMGPTASGKTRLAEALAEARKAQLVNADAFQVYRGFDVGTAKPEDRPKYRLLDIKEPTEEYGVGEWTEDAARVLKDCYVQGQDAVLVGGTGFYIRALTEGYAQMKPPPDPGLRAELEAQEQAEGLPGLLLRLEALDSDAYTKVDRQNPVRVRRAIERALTQAEPLQVELPPFDRRKIAIMPPTAELFPDIEERTHQMLASGWPDEVAGLIAKEVPPECPAFRAIGYQDLRRVKLDRWPLGKAEESIVRATKKYAKRQLTWLRKEPNVNLVLLKSVRKENLDETLSACLTLTG
ncbi:MAG: tRNA (adenosine(37)-N6)-dimethylallyltransferase MiaA [Fimbriimonadaceae bacterium]